MDRLFLAGLVREIDSAVAGARVRAVRVDSSGRSLTLSLNKSGNKSGKKSGASSELELHLGPGSAGVFMRPSEIARKTGRARPREAKLEKLLASSVIVSVDMSELDRVVTIVLEQTRLSGKKRHLALVLELVAVRKSVYLIDVDTTSAAQTRSLCADCHVRNLPGLSPARQCNAFF